MNREIDLGGLRVPMPATDEWDLGEMPDSAARGVVTSSRSRLTSVGLFYGASWTRAENPLGPHEALNWMKGFGGEVMTRSLTSCDDLAEITTRLDSSGFSALVERDDAGVGALWLLAGFDSSEGRDVSLEAFVERLVPVFAEAFVGAWLADGSPFLPCGDRDAAVAEIEGFLREWAAIVVPQVEVVPTRVPVVSGMGVEEAVLVRVELPVFDEDFEDGLVPRDLPGLEGAGPTRRWVAEIDLATGAVDRWPEGRVQDSVLWVKDAGVYELVDAEGAVVARLEDGYVPRGLFASSAELFGDGFRIHVGADGRFVDWRDPIVLSDFEVAE